MDSSVSLSCISKYVKKNSKLPWQQKLAEQNLLPVVSKLLSSGIEIEDLSCC